MELATSPRTAASSTSSATGDVQIVKPDRRHRRPRSTLTVSHRQRERPARHRAGPGLRHQPLALPLLLAAPTPERATASRRFTVNGDTLDLTSEKVSPRGPAQRDECCHAGGSLAFDTNGNLYLATGDNTNPFASDGFDPIDERAGRAYWDAQRTRGQHERPAAARSCASHPRGRTAPYTIPAGNLFPAGTAQTRPEIYAMGFRNPFRIAIDPKTGTVLMGDYGPDAGSASAEPRPAGHRRVEHRQPARQLRLAVLHPRQRARTSTTTSPTKPSGPEVQLRRAGQQLAQQHRPDQPAAGDRGDRRLRLRRQRHRFPELGGGGAPMAGPVYHYDADLARRTQVAGVLRRQGVLRRVEQRTGSTRCQLNADGNALVETSTRRSLGMTFKRPMDMEFGPDGALYLIEWGSGFNGNNADSGIYRIDYIKGDPRADRARRGRQDQRRRAAGGAVLQRRVERPRRAARSPTRWDFDGDGTTDSTDGQPDAHLHHGRQLHRTADGHRPDGHAPPRRTADHASATPRRRSRSTCRRTAAFSDFGDRSRTR